MTLEIAAENASTQTTRNHPDMFVHASHAETAQTLRTYQQEAIVAIRRAWSEGQTPLVSMATGLGKTSVIAQLLVEEIDPAKARALVLAHTQELIYQPAERIANQFNGQLKSYFGAQFAPGIGIVMGSHDQPDARIVVATRQSLHPKRLQEVLSYGKIDVLVHDEAHHAAPGTSNLEIIKAVREHNPDVRVVGFTATPKRTDRKALAAVFSQISYDYGIVPAIRDGWLVPPTRIRVATQIEASHIRTVNGDYNQQQLSAVLDANNWIELAVQAYQDYIQQAGRPALAFFPGVDKSINFTAALQAQGIGAAHIDANTPKEQRMGILRDFKAGRLQVVSNMAVLTEGVDLPQVSAILMARPTRSETLLTQILGRGLRLYPGKQDCLFVDLTVHDTKALEVGTLLGKLVTCPNPSCQAQVFKGFKACPQCGTKLPVEKAVKACPVCENEVPRTASLCPHCGYTFPVDELRFRIEPDRGEGGGLVDEVVSLFATLSTAWHRGGDDYLSCAVGYDAGALVIAPPSYEDVDRVRERLFRGGQLLRQFDQDGADPELKAALLEQMGMLERQLKRADQYSLYYVPSILRETVDGPYKTFQRDLPEDLQPPVEYIRSNGDLAGLMVQADRELLRRASESDSSRYVKRDAQWRARPASDGQRWLLKRLGYKVLADDLSNGDASAMISHVKSVKRVQVFVQDDTLPERKGE